uniref:Bm14286 n=1 Tax=Brugia malayi TaxID=6279 RepID=A0A1I9G4R0_BRUMA|nr:Bm14286 [Brugia malayi]
MELCTTKVLKRIRFYWLIVIELSNYKFFIIGNTNDLIPIRQVSLRIETEIC